MFTLGDSETRWSIFTFYDGVLVQVLGTWLETISVTWMNNYRTFKSSISGSTSEYPVANAIGSKLKRVLARCSVMVSVRVTVRDTMNTRRDCATNEKALPNRWPMKDHNLTVTALQGEVERTFNFAIRVLMVWRNSPAVGCEVFCESKRFFNVENSL